MSLELRRSSSWAPRRFQRAHSPSLRRTLQHSRTASTAIFKNFDEPSSPGCAVAAYQDDRILCRRAYGLANLEHDVRLTPTSLFDVAVSKQFTAAAILPPKQYYLALGDSITYGFQRGTRGTSTTLPSFEELKTGWNELRPGGDTTCSKGTPYAFYVRPGARDKLLVVFQGGGGCWRGEECDRGWPWYLPDINFEEAKDPPWRRGIFDLEHPDNPFSTYSTVYVRYCTGDVHLGDRDATYTVKSGTGETRQFVIHHRGQVNATAVLEWIHRNFPAPREIFVSGTSAGAVATPFYASALSRHYKQARVVGLVDGAGHHTAATMAGVDRSNWGHPDVLRRHPGWEQFPEKWGMADHYITADRAAPRLRLFQVDYAYDQALRTYIQLAGTLNPDLLALLRANQREIGQRVGTFRFFTVGGRAHRVMQEDWFYALETDGHRFRDWVAAIAVSQPVASVDCTDCSRSEFRFSEQDLRSVERSLELLSPAGAWNPHDDSKPCPGGGDRYTMRCALVRAIREVIVRPPSNPPAPPAPYWEVMYTVIRRMGTAFEQVDAERQAFFEPDPVVLYNNLPGATAAGVISLLEEVRDRIRADLRRRTKQ